MHNAIRIISSIVYFLEAKKNKAKGKLLSQNAAQPVGNMMFRIRF